MQRTVMGVERRVLVIGVGCGAIAGLIGVAHWAIMQSRLSVALSQLNARYRLYGGGWVDGTGVARDYELFYFITAPVAAYLSVLACFMAAPLVYRASQNLRDGVVAMCLAATLGIGMWVLATVVAVDTSPDPSMTEGLLGCDYGLGLLVVATLVPLIPVIARAGVKRP